MQITVELFGTLREFRAADANGDAFPQDIIANTTVGDILGRLEIPTEKTLIILVNSVQTFADVVIQKSTREGFCLAVTEALWKGRPVVASNIGGIPAQIEDGKSGYLLEPKDFQGFADRIVHLLNNPKEAKELGHNAREIVRQKYLITRLLSDYLDLLNSVINGNTSS